MPNLEPWDGIYEDSMEDMVSSKLSSGLDDDQRHHADMKIHSTAMSVDDDANYGARLHTSMTDDDVMSDLKGTREAVAD